mgnify:CR=1 FL=1
MALRDLILGRRRKAAISPETGTSRVGTTVALAEVAEDTPPAAPPPAEAAPSRGDQTKRAILGRVKPMILNDRMPSAERCQAVLDRLAMVVDACEVRITAHDGKAGIVVVARQVAFARIALRDAPVEVFDFRPVTLPVEMVVRFVRMLAELCSMPQDLLVEEQAVAGVFAADGGLALDDILFDETAFLELLAARYELVDGEEGPGDATPPDAVAPDLPPDPPGQEPGLSDQPSAETVVRVDEGPAATPVDAPLPEPAPAAAREIAATDFPFAFLESCRSQAEDVLRHTRAGAAALPATRRVADRVSDAIAGQVFADWHRQVAPILGQNLVAVFVPAAPKAPVTVLATDGESTTAFRGARVAMGGLSRLAVKAFDTQP